MRRDGTAIGVGSALTALACLLSHQEEHEEALDTIQATLSASSNVRMLRPKKKR